MVAVGATAAAQEVVVLVAALAMAGTEVGMEVVVAALV